MAVKSRVLSLYSEPWSSTSGSSSYKGTTTVQGKQETESHSTGWPANRGSGRDVGSEFSTTKETFKVVSPCYANFPLQTVFGSKMAYTGPILSYDPAQVFSRLRSTINWTSWLTLNGMGATAISRTIPTSPAVDMMTFGAELAREGIPKAIGHTLLRDRRPSLKGSADEYLNYQFGIAPVVSDTMSLVDTVSKSAKIMRQYERDSGRNIRRQYRFPTFHDESTNVLIPGNHLNYVHNQLLLNGGGATAVRTTTRDVWFSGCFTYYLNLGKSQSDRLEYAAQQAKRLYGVRLTPDVLWNLAPWSWAADWATNIGDVLQNLSAFSTDGLVMRYGYIMEHYVAEISTSRTGIRPTSKGSLTSSRASEIYRVERKIRRKATPFGFGLDPGTFTSRQWSILAALGISRSSGRL